MEPSAATAAEPMSWRGFYPRSSRPLPMRNRFFVLRLLRLTLLVGGLGDLFLAGGLLIAPSLLERFFAYPLPDDRLYLWLLGLLVATLGVLVLAAADDPRRYSAVVFVTAAGRGASGLAIGAQAAAVGDDRLWLLAAFDVGLALAQAFLWVRQR